MPVEELRLRDPLTGRRLPAVLQQLGISAAAAGAVDSKSGTSGSGSSSSTNHQLLSAAEYARIKAHGRALYGEVAPTKLDHKGQYGVALVWSDGHYADIFPYEVLRAIADEIEMQEKIA